MYLDKQQESLHISYIYTIKEKLINDLVNFFKLVFIVSEKNCLENEQINS